MSGQSRNRSMIEAICAQCGGAFQAEAGFAAFCAKQGRSMFCCRAHFRKRWRSTEKAKAIGRKSSKRFAQSERGKQYAAATRDEMLQHMRRWYFTRAYGAEFAEAAIVRADLSKQVLRHPHRPPETKNP